MTPNPLCQPVAVPFTTYPEAVAVALEAIAAPDLLSGQTAIMIKPNLVNASPFPVTTSPDCCAAVIEYVRQAAPQASLVLAEGTGQAGVDTAAVFSRLGYDDLAAAYDIPLLDLNEAPLERRTDPHCKIFPEIYLPHIAFTHFIVSVPVLKAHSLSEMTGTLKNMMGLAPPSHYGGRGGSWKKAVFHENMHQAIKDLNHYRRPDLTVMDARVGLAQYHLGGPTCDPPVNQILAGTDPVALDRAAAGLLNLDWRRIPHLRD